MQKLPRRSIILFLLSWAFITPMASGQLRVVSYNVARLQGSESDLSEVFAALSADDRPGFAVAPHVYVMQEVAQSNVVSIGNLLNTAAGVTYASATYTNANEDGVAGAQALFFRTDTLVEVPSGHLDLETGAGRRADRWQLRLVGYDDPPVELFVYGAHLKASQGQSNEQLRLEGVNTIRADADTLPAGSHIIYAGDFNFYGNDEPGYEAFLAVGPGQANDPLGFGSWSGSGQAIKHTQSPRSTSDNGLVGGGMDDRFDFQLGSDAMSDGAGLAILPGTYRTFGNDGQHYNASINDGNNFYYPADVPRSNALADALHEASDHLPIVADYQVPAVLTASLPATFGRVMRNAPVSVTLEVRNDADVATPLGADTLDFAAVGEDALAGACEGTAFALGEPATCTLDVDTAQVGPAVG
ncbi:MAG: hypothetical protein ACYTGC_19960, partial [Planctomycetota bacterium]